MKNQNGMKKQRGYISRQQCLTLVACLCLFIGIGRMFSLVAQNPLLGYANNYDMIRLQACHQIWPADKAVNITVGTPSAPLRRYTLDKHVDTPCFPSTELLFTGIGIELAKLKNLVTGEVLISIKTIGFVKAIFLALTSLLASLYFHRKGLHHALLANALVTLLVLSDPGVTLYLNTFYKEFSAVYFLYVTLIGVIVLAQSDYKISASWVMLAGLAGLGFSKPLYMPVALCVALPVSVYVVTRKQWKTAPAILLFALLPLVLQAGGWFTPRNDSMIRAGHINLVGSMLAFTGTPDGVLADLGLPQTCQVLAGKTGYDPAIQKAHRCPEIDSLATTTTLHALISNPVLLARMATHALGQQKNWLQDSLGQVEGRHNTTASLYQRTLGSWLEKWPENIFVWLFLACVFMPALALTRSAMRQNGKMALMALMALLQLAVLLSALLGNGLVEASQNLFLLIPLAITEILAAASIAVYSRDKQQ